MKGLLAIATCRLLLEKNGALDLHFLMKNSKRFFQTYHKNLEIRIVDCEFFRKHPPIIPPLRYQFALVKYVLSCGF